MISCNKSTWFLLVVAYPLLIFHKSRRFAFASQGINVLNEWNDQMVQDATAGESPSNVPNAESAITNVTKLDCGMRKLALEYAKTLHFNPQVHQHVADALRLEALCGFSFSDSLGESDNNHYDTRTIQTQRKLKLQTQCALPNNHCLFVSSKSPGGGSKKGNLRYDSTTITNEDGTEEKPFTSIHDAIEASRKLRQDSDRPCHISIIIGAGIHELHGQTIRLSSVDEGLSIIGDPTLAPEQQVWFSGGVAVNNIIFDKDPESGIHVGNLTTLLEPYSDVLPHILSLFSTDRRWTRARYPNADFETDQWGYASPDHLEHSIDGSEVLEWHLPPKGALPKFELVDFQDSPPPGVPHKNNSAQRGYNWYTSGRGGVCADVWGPEANSYWCSNATQGGWSEVDAECAASGQIQLPIGLTYNISSERLGRFHNKNSTLKGGILHAWHSQSWSMHMFEISCHMPQTGVIQLVKGGGRQGARNWCRCDQCTYAAGWCGQHQTPEWHDTRLISGTWMIENVLQELDQIGEYFFDKDSNLLHIKPNATTDLIDLRVALLEEILEVSSGATDITIENIGFRDTAPTYHPNLDWSPPSGGDWSMHRGGAILIENATHVNVKNCQFRRLDGNAIFLSRRNRNITIQDNYFEWLGENAIATWGDTDGYDGTAENFPMYTTIQGNVMRELGIFQKQSSAVGQAKAAFTDIRNNIMFNMPRAAINFNDMVGGGDTVHGNLIFNTCRESGDHGPINSWDRQPFLTTLRDGHTKSFDPAPREINQNFIIANYGASQGVDNDDGSSWFHIHHNLFYSAEGFKMDYGGHDSVFEDNLVMAFPYDGSQCFNMGSFNKGHGDTLRNNRCLVGLGHKTGSGCGDPSCADPIPETDESQQIVGHLWGGCDIDSPVLLADNQYYTPDGEVKISCGNDAISLEQLQTKFGMEIGSTRGKFPDEDTLITWAKDMLPLSRHSSVAELVKESTL